MAYIGNSPVQDETVTSAQIVDGAILNEDVNSSAAIAFSKMANLTASRVLVSDGSGDVSVSDVTSAETLILDGGTSATSTTLAAADRVIVNDNGTMVQVALSDFETFFESALDTINSVTSASSLATVGALNSGSITSGFGTIDTGSSNITTTGVGSFGSLDISGAIDVDGTTNLDAVDIDGAVQIDNTITIGADDQGYDVIFYGDTASSNMTWDTSVDDLILNDARIVIDQDDDANGIVIDSESANNDALSVSAKYAIYGLQDISGGRGMYIERNIAEAGSNPLVTFVNDNDNNTQPTLKIQQDGTGYGINIDHNADGTALYIDAENTSQPALYVNSDAITSGKIAYLYSSSSSNSARKLLDIVNDHTSADNAILLHMDQDGNATSLWMNTHDAGFSTDIIFVNAVGRSSNSGFNFLKTYTDGDDDIQHKLQGDGEAYADAAWNASGADYAEYFESKDGSKIAIGTTVKLDGDKVVACESEDTPMGVIRPQGCSANIGNNAWSKWQGKYLMDDYGYPIKEEYTVTEWIDGIKDGKNNDIQYQTDKIPDDVTVPDDATVKSTEYDGSKLMRKKLNPDYGESIEYEPREERDEWHIVGLLGQIPITKGQPTGNWIKMKDVSDTVEMYFVK